MRVLQLNLNHCEAAEDLLRQNVIEHKIDIAVLSEPYSIERNSLWVTDRSGMASIWACGRYPLQQSASITEDGCTWVKV